MYACEFLREGRERSKNAVVLLDLWSRLHSLVVKSDAFVSFYLPFFCLLIVFFIAYLHFPDGSLVVYVYVVAISILRLIFFALSLQLRAAWRFVARNSRFFMHSKSYITFFMHFSCK